MSVEDVKRYLTAFGMDGRVQEFDTSSATVELAAQAVGTAKMLTPDQAIEMVGHAVGGVCPFALPPDVGVYLDESLRRFDTVFPAAGSAASAIELTCEELERCCSNFKEWIDVCKGWQEPAQ